MVSYGFHDKPHGLYPTLSWPRPRLKKHRNLRPSLAWRDAVDVYVYVYVYIYHINIHVHYVFTYTTYIYVYMQPTNIIK